MPELSVERKGGGTVRKDHKDRRERDRDRKKEEDSLKEYRVIEAPVPFLKNLPLPPDPPHGAQDGSRT